LHTLSLLAVAVLEARAQVALQEQLQVGIHPHLAAAQQFLLLAAALEILTLRAEQVVLEGGTLERVQQVKEIKAVLATTALKVVAVVALEQ
jgi:hypothetical protein